MRNIIVLDGYTLNPGDLSWEALEALGNCTIYSRTAEAEVVVRAEKADILLTNKTPLSSTTIEQLPDLRYIGVMATGYNVVDVKAASRRNIPVTNVPAYGTQSVAQMVFAHLLNLTQHVAYHSHTVFQKRWNHCKDFCYWDYPLVELAGLNMGIIGVGRIGQTVVELARAFGMQVLGYNPSVPVDTALNLNWKDLETVFRESDVISLHCPLTEQTRGLINRKHLAWMKKSAILINTSRGALIDEDALAEALNAGDIAGAGLDVLSVEPSTSNNPLFKAKNCFITPHIAWATKAARMRLMNIMIDNIKMFLLEKPQNVVN